MYIINFNIYNHPRIMSDPTSFNDVIFFLIEIE